MTMEKLANHIIAVAQKNEIAINKYKLQKVMYLTLKKAKENGVLYQEELEQIYDEPFVLYAYGPKLVSQSERFEVFRGAPIIGSGFKIDQKLNNLNPIILNYLTKSVIDLVKESRETPFWKKNHQYLNGFTSDVLYRLKDL